MATASVPLAEALRDAGGASAPASATAGLRHALRAALEHGRDELERRKSGYPDPVTVAFAAGPDHLLAALPLAAAFAADPAGSPARALILAAGVVAAQRDLVDGGTTTALELRVGDHEGFLLLARPSASIALAELDELVPLVVGDRLGGVDRLRAQGLAVPHTVLADAAARLREPIGHGHPLRVAEALVALGGDPVDPASLEAREDEVLAIVGTEPVASRPHDDPDPARRIARRILQRLDGFGKWGGYHTEFAHLSRGFASNEKARAQEVAEALIAAGLLAEKPSVGQRHVYLNPRRVADIRGLIEHGTLPAALVLPRD